MASHALRWAVDVYGWEPGAAEWAFLLAQLSEGERERTCRFVFRDDQKRALVSRLMQRRCCAEVLSAPRGAPLPMGLTKGGKPFVRGSVPRPPSAPNFNYNVSHEGAWVVLAAEPLLLVGVDVAAPQGARRGAPAAPRCGKAAAQGAPDVNPKSLEQLFDSMAGSLSPAEWAHVRAGRCAAAQESAFRQLWSLKEAFVKARGDGLAFHPLARAEFTLRRAGCDGAGPGEGGSEPACAEGGAAISLRVDGAEAAGWSFSLQQLPADHWVAVARGPPEAAVDAWGEFTATMASRPLSAAACVAARCEPRSGWALLRVEGLLAEELRDGHADARRQDCGEAAV